MAHLITPQMVEKGRRAKRITKVIDSLITVKVGSAINQTHYDILDTLHSSGVVPCPKPLFFVEFDGGVNGIVMSTIPGRTLDFAPITKKQMKRIATDIKNIEDAIQPIMAARFPRPEGNDLIYSVAERGSLRFPIMDGFHSSPIHLSSFVDDMMELSHQVPELVDTQRELLSSLAQGEIRYCHMDIHPLNIIVKNGRLTGLIDWDASGWYTTYMNCYRSVIACQYELGLRRRLLKLWDMKDAPFVAGAEGRLKELQFGWREMKKRDSRARIARWQAEREPIAVEAAADQTGLSSQDGSSTPPQYGASELGERRC